MDSFAKLVTERSDTNFTQLLNDKICKPISNQKK